MDLWFSLSLVISALYVLVLLFPLFSLLKSSFTPEGASFSLAYFKTFFTEPYYYQTLVNSLQVTVAVTFFSVLVALPLAYVMTSMKIKGAIALQIMILLSSMSPPFIGAYSWILLLGRSGVITKFLGRFGVKGIDIYGLKGIIMVLTLQLVPLIYMYLMGAMKNIDRSLMEAAESMGCVGAKRVWKVVIPLVFPSMLAGALMVFMRALADFGTPMLIGEGFQTVPVMIFNQFINEMGGDAGFAAAISVIVIIFALAIFLLQKAIAAKHAFSMSALHPMIQEEAKGMKGILVHLFVYGYVLLSVFPQLYVVYTSFLKTSGKIFVPGFSLQSYQQAFDRLGSAIRNTFSYALISLALVLVLGVLIAYISVKRRNAMSGALDVMSMLPYVVPGSVMGIALLLAFNKRPLLLSGTAIILIIAYVIRRLPYTIRSSAAMVYQISPSIEEAAASLGASNRKTFLRIMLPMMKSGIISGAILSWITIITELSSSILLYNARTRTITVSIYTEVLRGNYGIAAALASLLMALTVLSLLLFFKLTGKREIAL